MVDHLSPEALATYGDTSDPAEAAEEVEIQETTPDTPEVAPEEQQAPAPDPVVTWEQKAEELGGEQRIQDALQISEALRSEEGLRALVAEGMEALGLDPATAEAILQGEEPPDPDALMTRAEYEAEKAKERQSFQEQQRQRDEAVAHQAVNEKLSALGVDADPDARAIVLTFAQKHVDDPNNLSPAYLQAALQKGYDEYVAAIDRLAGRAVEKKVEQAASVPKVLRGGGAPATSETPEAPPKNMEEARAAVRRLMPEAFQR